MRDRADGRRADTPAGNGVLEEPTYGPYTMALVERRLSTIPRDGKCMPRTLRRTHYTSSSRNHHWRRLVEQLYAHRDKRKSLAKIRHAFAKTRQVRRLRAEAD